MSSPPIAASVTRSTVILETITDASDDRLRGYRDLTDVALRVKLEPETGIYIAESASVIERALAAGHRPMSVLMEDKWLERMQPILNGLIDFPIYVADRTTLETKYIINP